MGLFRAAHGWGGQKGPIPKICQTNPTVTKLGTVIPKSKKYINHATPQNLLTSAFFHRKLAIFVILRNTDIDCI